MTPRSTLARVPAVVLLGVLVLPVAALALGATGPGVMAAWRDPLFADAVALSLGTSAVGMLCVVLLGTPLASWLAHAQHARPGVQRVLSVVVDVPVVVPPAVLGVGLLLAFGPRGLLGPALGALGWTVPFSTAAVVLAQTLVATPFYVQAAASALASVPEDTRLVARTLGATEAGVWWRVVLPTAWPGMLAGLSLAWARALGEFGATLLFAGNLPGTTQTMPLAILTALERDVQLAVGLALALVAIAGLGLALLRGTAAWALGQRGRP